MEQEIKLNRNFYITPQLLHYSDNFSPDTKERVLYTSKKFLFDTPYQEKYYNLPLDSYFGMKRLVMFASFLTELANTYVLTKEDVIAINPFYLYSMFDYSKSGREWRKGSTWSTLYNLIDTSPYLRQYILLEEKGGRYKIGNEYAYFCSTYRIQYDLKEYAMNELQNDMFYKITLHEDGGLLSTKETGFSKRGYIKKDVRYYDVINNETGDITQFKDRKEARTFCKKEQKNNHDVEIKEVAGFVHELEKHIDFGHPYSYFDIVCDKTTALVQHDWFVKEKENAQIPAKKTFFSTHAKINQKELDAVLTDVQELNNLKHAAVEELFRIQALTCENDDYYISYYLSRYGRFYPNNCNFNLIPSHIRDRIMSGYMGIDMCCSNYALNLNMAYNSFEENKNKKSFQKRFNLIDKNGNIKDFNTMFSEIIEMCKDRKTYRKYMLKLINEHAEVPWSEEDIKKILTMIGFGANANNALIFLKSCSDMKNCRDSALLHQGFSVSDINYLVNIPKFQLLAEQMKILSKIVVASRTITKKEDGKNVRYLKSFKNQEVKLGRGVMTFSQKVAFLTQSMESVITYDVLGEATMGDLFGNDMVEKIDRKTKVKDLTGLFLHDGFYLQSDIFEKLNLSKEQLEKILSQRITEYIRKYFEKEGLTGFILLYEVEILYYKETSFKESTLKQTA